MLVYAIESSCDDTCAAIVHKDRTIVKNIVMSQARLHSSFGGVVPDMAAQAHVDALNDMLRLSLDTVDWNMIDAIAVTKGPGLIGSLLVGSNLAKGLAIATKKPLILVNHLLGHILTPRLITNLQFPYLAVLISGGHCMIVLVNSPNSLDILGKTIDDSLGEVFDKTANVLGFGYPGGPAIELAARNGDISAFQFPMPICDRSGCDFSFSGLKTAVRRLVIDLKKDNNGCISDTTKANICASFQYTVCQILKNRIANALKMIKCQINAITIVGGVSANIYIKQQITEFAAKYNLNLIVAPPALCTDNAAMIAWTAIEMLEVGILPNFNENIDPKLWL